MPTAKRKPPRKKPVQVSIDQGLLKEMDAQTGGRRRRSAFIGQAIQLLLRAMREKKLQAELEAAYAGKADELWSEVRPWLPEQVWSPDDDLVETSTPARKRARG